MAVFELLCSLGLVLPAFNKPLDILTPVAAVCIAAEMLLFCGMHILSGDANYCHVIYWLVVAAICAFIAYGRFVLRLCDRLLTAIALKSACGLFFC